MARVLAILVYPLVLAGRLMNALGGRDPLRLRRPPPGSLWIARTQPGRPAYFAETSQVEGRGHRGFGRIAGRTLVALSAHWGRARGKPAHARTRERERDIPDEIYTLW